MTEQLEKKLTGKETYKMAREIGFDRVTSAYWSLPIALENFGKVSKELMTPTVQSIQVDKKARTYHIVEENAVFGNHIIETYANILELRGYTKI
jgi:hypothetical protein